jgi:hypothetical protein
MWRAVFLSSVLSSALLAAPARSLAGPIEIVADSVVADAINRRTTFQITFNEIPELFDVDALGRPVNAFQYFYDSQVELEPDGIFSGDTIVVIRGPEIRFHDSIPVRDSHNPDGEDFPHAEGWGAMRGVVDDLTLDGATVRFTVPWSTLGETDGKFSYHLIALERGDQTSSVAATVIPLPRGVGVGCVGLAGAATSVAWSHRSQRRARREP